MSVKVMMKQADNPLPAPEPGLLEGLAGCSCMPGEPLCPRRPPASDGILSGAAARVEVSDGGAVPKGEGGAESPQNRPRIAPESPIAPADHARIDALEAAALAAVRRGELPVVDLPLVHRFTPGIYIREIFMPAGTLCTSKVHRGEHPYVVTKGRVSVYIPGVGVQEIGAGHFGVTKPGTRRVLYIHEDTTWITFHPNADDSEDLTVIEARLIERRELADGTTAHDAYAALLSELPQGFLPKEVA